MPTKKRNDHWVAEGVLANVGTDVASFVIASPRPLGELAGQGEEWWEDEPVLGRALQDGLAAGFVTHQDGTFAMRWTRGVATDRERALLADEATFRLRVEGGHVLVGAPGSYDPDSPDAWTRQAIGIALEDGAYRVHVQAIAWMEEAGASTPSGKRSKNALPSFVLSFERVDTLAQVPAPGSPAWPALRWDKSRARQQAEAKEEAALDLRRAQLGALALAPSAQDVEVLLAALGEPRLRESAQAALAHAPTSAVSAALVRALQEELSRERPERRPQIDALFLAVAPHRSPEASAIAQNVLTTYPVGAGRVLLAAGSPEPLRRVADLLANPGAPEKALAIAVEAAFALGATEAFDRLSSHLRAERPSYPDRQTGGVILQQLGRAPADPRWRSLLFRTFDAGNYPACLVALAVAQLLGPANGDVAAIARQALDSKTAAYRGELLAWLRSSGNPQLTALATGSPPSSSAQSTVIAERIR